MNSRRLILSALIAIPLEASAKGIARKNNSPRTKEKQATPVKSAKRSQPGNSALRIVSEVAVVEHIDSGRKAISKNANLLAPIASITKLMTALVVVDSSPDFDEQIVVTEEDVDLFKHSKSRLPVGSRLSRKEMLHLALMASENRAAHALARNHRGGLDAFVDDMNRTASSLGMTHTRFADPTGLLPQNVSTGEDLVKLVKVGATRPLISRFSTDTSDWVQLSERAAAFKNTNRLVGRPDWDINLSKTGFTSEAGRCLVMHAEVAGDKYAIALLDAPNGQARMEDAMRIKSWLLSHKIA